MSGRAEAVVNLLAARLTSAAACAQARALAMQSENTVAALRGEPVPHAAAEFYAEANKLDALAKELCDEAEQAWIEHA